MSIAANLKRIRKEKGISQPKLAEKSGVSQQLISQIENGLNDTTNRLPQLARALGVGVADLDPAYAGIVDEILPGVEGLVPVRRAGTVEAGAFRRADEFEEEGDFRELYEPRDQRFPDARQAYYDVAGDSMNALKPRPILDGDRAICIDYDDLKGRLLLRDGMVVVVEQTLAGGHVRERSIKQVELYEDRIEFCPRSTNPKHKPIVVKKDLHADDGRTVEVIAIVRRVTNDLPI